MTLAFDNDVSNLTLGDLNRLLKLKADAESQKREFSRQLASEKRDLVKHINAVSAHEAGKVRDELKKEQEKNQKLWRIVVDVESRLSKLEKRPR